jgi:hypothetical protein
LHSRENQVQLQSVSHQPPPLQPQEASSSFSERWPWGWHWSCLDTIHCSAWQDLQYSSSSSEIKASHRLNWEPKPQIQP